MQTTTLQTTKHTDGYLTMHVPVVELAGRPKAAGHEPVAGEQPPL